MFAITAPTAVVLGILSIVLSLRVSFQRGKSKAGLGDGGDPVLFERIRQHGNLTEYAPMGLILLGLAEAQGASAGWLYCSAIVLVVARLLHPLGISHKNPTNPLRIVGAVGTSLSMLVSIVAILLQISGA